MGRKYRDLSGQKFGKLTAIEFVGINERWASWRCACDCGNELIVSSRYLVGGIKKSCGCVRRQNYKDLSGHRFNKLTAIEFVGTNEKKTALWRCACDCGNELIVQSSILSAGNKKSCGCIKRHRDLSGQIFGRLTVIEFVGTNEKKTALWRCTCDCGNEPIIQSSLLLTGSKKSCGCIKRDRAKNAKNRLPYQDLKLRERIWIFTEARTLN